MTLCQELLGGPNKLRVRYLCASICPDLCHETKVEIRAEQFVRITFLHSIVQVFHLAVRFRNVFET